MRRFATPTTVLFTLTLFTSAFLLFLIQPMVGKMVLPLFGGAPAVWNTCMVFFQALLLAGYAYAHASTAWLRPRRQAVLHLVLLLAPAAVLPVAVNRSLAHAADADPAAWLLLTLLLAVGLPFFVVSATAPLLQKWFADTAEPGARDPYFLYAASNLGSMLALVGYPLLVEPHLTLAGQRVIWSVGYGVLALLIAACAVLLWKAPSERPSRDRAGAAQAPGTAPRSLTAAAPPTSRRVHWVLLAFAPSSLMLGVTTYLTTDVTSHPLLWLPPLVLYLLSFVLVFSSAGWVRAGRRFWIFALPLLVLILLYLMLSGAPLSMGWVLALHLGVLFTACMVCHGELARDRPAPARLTEFFLWIAVGGVLGGLFNALVAPLAFYGVVEYPLALVLACLLLPPVNDYREGVWGFRIDVGLAAVFTLLGLALIGLRLEDDTLDASGLAGGRWAWQLAAVVIAASAGLAYVLRARDGRRARAMDFLLPLALGVLAVGLFWGAAARVVYAPLSRIAAALGQQPATLQKVLVFGLPLVLCFTFVARSLRFGLAVGAFLLAAGYCSLFNSPVLYQTRNFYGVLQVIVEARDGREYYCLYNGTTLHGQQAAAGAGRDEPLSYYHRTGPIGQVFAAYNREGEPPRDLAVIGLGAGALASYGRKGQNLTFYEIDPEVAALCRDSLYFTYWNDAAARGVGLNLVPGDARLTLADEARSGNEIYGILVVDAFTSDAIPLHLIDREALALYLGRLTEDGVVAFHVSNRNLDLRPVLANLAGDAGLAGLYDDDTADGIPGKAASTWVVLARKKENLARLPRERRAQDGGTEPAWRELQPDPSVGVWTDDYSNLFSVLRLGK